MTTIRNYINPKVLEVSDTNGSLIVKFRSINPQYNPLANDAPEFIYTNEYLHDLEEQMLFIEDVLEQQESNSLQGNNDAFRQFHTSISTILKQTYDAIEAQDEPNKNKNNNLHRYDITNLTNQSRPSIIPPNTESTKIHTSLNLEKQLLDYFTKEIDRPSDLAKFLCVNFEHNPN